MKQKNYFRLKSLFLISALFVFAIALALQGNAVTEISCTADFPSVIQVGTEVNASFNATRGNDLSNFSQIFVAFEMRSASTANSSFSLIGNVSNTTAANHTNMTIPSSGLLNLEPSNDYQGRATCYATTGGGAGDNVTVSSTVTGLTIDLGDTPSVPTAISPTGRNTETRDYTFTATVIGANTTSCILTFTANNPGSKIYAMTHSGNTCTQAISNIPEGTLPYTITASDGTNSSITIEQDFSISIKGASARKAKVFNVLGGGGKSQESIGKGLAIASATRAGEVSQGLAKAQAKINEFTQKETQPKELTKTGIGLGTGIAIGVLVPTLIIPGVGFITAPILGGLIGAGIGVAI